MFSSKNENVGWTHIATVTVVLPLTTLANTLGHYTDPVNGNIVADTYQPRKTYGIYKAMNKITPHFRDMHAEHVHLPH